MIASQKYKWGKRAVLAYAMINIKPAKEDGFLSKIEKIEDVREAHVVFGEHGISAKIGVESTEKLRHIMVSQIRLLDVISTKTVIVAKGPQTL